MMKMIITVFFCTVLTSIKAQKSDTVVTVAGKMITLSEVVAHSGLNIQSFIDRVKNDTTFYKAFRNLHILGFTSLNDIRILSKSQETKASMYSKTKQLRKDNCRSMEVLDERVNGDMYDDNHHFNYYTAQLYGSLFFTDGVVCGENNIVAGKSFSTEGKSGLDKHKEQLKMLFFNPGKKIKGIPFLSNKTEIFGDDLIDKYDINIDLDEYNKTSCYIFSLKVKPGNEGDVVIDHMTTWFDDKTFEVIGRDYSLSYDAGIYDFNVQMEVQMMHWNEYLVPSLIRYSGNWKAIFKERERGVFTATLFDFKK